MEKLKSKRNYSSYEINDNRFLLASLKNLDDCYVDFRSRRTLSAGTYVSHNPRYRADCCVLRSVRSRRSRRLPLQSTGITFCSRWKKLKSKRNYSSYEINDSRLLASLKNIDDCYVDFRFGRTLSAGTHVSRNPQYAEIFISEYSKLFECLTP